MTRISLSFATTMAMAIVIITSAGWTGADDRKRPVPVAKPAATYAEAVEAVITALRQPKPTGKPAQPENFDAALDGLATGFKALRPHLSESSQEVLDAYSDLIARVKAHDAVAQKQFGKKLEKEEDYMPAAMIVIRVISASTLLLHPPEGKTEVVRKTEKSATEVVVELRWSVPVGEGDEPATMDETVVAVKETGGWKIYLPTRRIPFGLDSFGGTPGRPAKPEVWDAEKVRKGNKETIPTVKAMTAEVKRLTESVEAGKYKNTKAYVEAVYSVAYQDPTLPLRK